MFNATKLGMLCGYEDNGPFLMLRSNTAAKTEILSLSDENDIHVVTYLSAIYGEYPTGTFYNMDGPSTYDPVNKELYVSKGSQYLIGKVDLKDVRNPYSSGIKYSNVFIYNNAMDFDSTRNIGFASTSNNRLFSFYNADDYIQTNSNKNIGSHDLRDIKVDMTRMVVFGASYGQLYAVPYGDEFNDWIIQDGDITYINHSLTLADRVRIDKTNHKAYVYRRSTSKISVIDTSNLSAMVELDVYDFELDWFITGSDINIQDAVVDEANDTIYVLVTATAPGELMKYVVQLKETSGTLSHIDIYLGLMDSTIVQGGSLTINEEANKLYSITTSANGFEVSIIGYGASGIIPGEFIWKEIPIYYNHGTYTDTTFIL